MLWQIAQSFIRHSLTTAGGGLIAHGLASSSDVSTGVGALMVLIGIGHSIFVKWLAQKQSTTTSAAASVPIKSLPIILLAIGIFSLTGCKSTPQQITYQAAGTTAVAVDTAMNLWGAYVAQDHPGTNEELAVESAYDQYQASMAVVCDAGAAYAATGGTNATATAALNQAIANSSVELSDLENLLTSFGVQLQ